MFPDTEQTGCSFGKGNTVLIHSCSKSYLLNLSSNAIGHDLLTVVLVTGPMLQSQQIKFTFCMIINKHGQALVHLRPRFSQAKEIFGTVYV